MMSHWRLSPFSLIALTVLTTMSISAQLTFAQDEQRPNILWIIAEDLGPELGVYDTPEVRTPNLDRLAARGMPFTQAFATSPVCSPSRSALASSPPP